MTVLIDFCLERIFSLDKVQIKHLINQLTGGPRNVNLYVVNYIDIPHHCLVNTTILVNINTLTVYTVFKKL